MPLWDYSIQYFLANFNIQFRNLAMKSVQSYEIIAKYVSVFRENIENSNKLNDYNSELTKFTNYAL